eukprot:8824292-Pyramimonas_sp.AAC.1
MFSTASPCPTSHINTPTWGVRARPRKISASWARASVGESSWIGLQPAWPYPGQNPCKTSRSLPRSGVLPPPSG